MTHGKNICNQLKEVRKRIAEENDIPLEIEECTYKGECRGTCPRCEAEVRYLENALADRLRLGKVATVAGLALGLATTAQAQAPQTDAVPLQDTTKTHKAECLGTLKGLVFDIKTNEPLPFCNVVLRQDGKQILVEKTDFDGQYTLKPIPFGDYTLCIKAPERKQPFEQGITVNKTGFTMMDVGMDLDSAVIVDGEKSPMIDIGMPTTMEEIIEQMTPGGKVNVPRDALGEIQVKLPGTPANQPTPKEQPAFYEDKEQQGVRVKVLSIAALALGMAASTVQASETYPAVLPKVPPVVKEAVHVVDSVTIKGTVVDSKTNEPLPFVTITIADSNGTTTVTRSDWDGNFSASVPRGDYFLTINSVGYAKYVVLEDHYTENRTLPTIKLECTAEMLEVVGMIEDKQPVIEIDPNGASQYLEKDGVKVIVR